MKHFPFNQSCHKLDNHLKPIQSAFSPAWVVICNTNRIIGACFLAHVCFHLCKYIPYSKHLHFACCLCVSYPLLSSICQEPGSLTFRRYPDVQDDINRATLLSVHSSVNHPCAILDPCISCSWCHGRLVLLLIPTIKPKKKMRSIMMWAGPAPCLMNT